MSKYAKGKIYKIYRQEEPEKVYIGSTIKTLSARFSGHKSDWKAYTEKEKGKYYSSFLLFEKGVESCVIELIEDYPCNSGEELRKREGYFILENKANCINQCNAGTGHSHNKERDKKYYETNREKILTKRNEYREKNKDIINAKARVKKQCQFCQEFFHSDSLRKHIKRKHPTSL